MARRKKAYSGIGGQAVLEGIMMKNKEKVAVAVRRPDGGIEVNLRTYDGVAGGIFRKVPFIRGIFSFLDSLVLGTGCLNYSAGFYMGEEDKEEEEPGFLERFLEKHFGDRAESILMGIITAFSFVLAIGVFMLLPWFIVELLRPHLHNESLLAIIEGGLRLLIFLSYVVLISLMKDIRRVYMYHGAEHKCINCVEKGYPLTVPNVMRSSRQHKRCGTSFLLFVMLVSILLFFFIRLESPVWRLVVRIALIPLIAGISYEIIRLAGKTDFFLVQLLSLPGLLLQRLTTREPTEDMAEVAIKAVEAVFDWKAFIRENFPETELNEEVIQEETHEEETHEEVTQEKAQPIVEKLPETYEACYREGQRLLQEAGVPEAKLDARLLLEAVCHTALSDLYSAPERVMSPEEQEAYLKLLEIRRQRIPLQHILGVQEFMGLSFYAEEGVLIPRQDTELLVEEALKELHDGMRILDVCTGSGCILLSIMHYSNGVSGVGTDNSEAALRLAGKNAAALGLSPELLLTDLTAGVEGPFDLVLSNPPYIPSEVIETLEPEVRDHDPRAALDGGIDGLDYYRRLCSEAYGLLCPEGKVFLEIGSDQADQVRELLELAGFVEIRVIQDYVGHDRVLRAVKPGLNGEY